MALTRAFLKGMNLTEEQVGAIIEAHTDSVDALKAQRDAYKEDADKLANVQKELDELKAANTGEGGKEALQKKYDALDKEFKDFEKSVETEKTLAQTKEAYKGLLKEAGVSEKRLDAVMKVTDFGNLKLDSEGKIVDSDKLKESIKTEWADFIEVNGAKGAQTANPPVNNPSGQPQSTGRAKQLASQYYANLYGVQPKEGT